MENKPKSAEIHSSNQIKNTKDNNTKDKVKLVATVFSKTPGTMWTRHPSKV